jgi:hypothetical protein
MIRKLNRQHLLGLLDSITPSNADADALSEAEFDGVLAAFCMGCPDPVRARWLLLECLDPLTDEELVDRALAMRVPTPAGLSTCGCPG